MKTALRLLSTTALFALLVVGGAVSAATNDLSGYAWSSTTGWVSFLGSNYAVTAAANGNLSGYAWSSNVGWISFNSSDTSGCPSGTCQANLNRDTGAVTGWAKAIAGGGAQSGGWDGWVYLGQSSRVGVNVSNCAWGGYAWGGGEDLNSGVIGWLSFSGPGYAVTGTGNSCTTVVDPGSVDLTAGSTTATPINSNSQIRFEAPIQNNGAADLTGDVDMRVQIAINSDYSSEFDINIDVDDAVTDLPGGSFKNGTYVWDNPPSGRHQVRICADPSNEHAESEEGNNCGPTTTFQVDNPGTGGGMSVSCSASPSSAGTGTSITWTATVQNNIGVTTYNWTGDESLSGSGPQTSKSYGSIGTKTARVTVEAENATNIGTCTVSITSGGGGGGGSSTASLSASPDEILVGESSTLTWSSTSASSCTGTGFSTGGATSGSVTVAPTEDATYQVECGSANDFETVEVLQPNITITVDGEADSIRVPVGRVVDVVWHAEDTDSCDIVGPGILVNNATDDPLDGSASTTITERSVYTIECDASTETFTESVTVNIPPDFEEF